MITLIRFIWWAFPEDHLLLLLCGIGVLLGCLSCQINAWRQLFPTRAQTYRRIDARAAGFAARGQVDD